MSIATSPSPSHTGSTLGTQLEQLRKKIAGRLHQGVYSEFRGYGLRRDLHEPVEKPQAKIPLLIRPLRESDLDMLLPAEGRGSEKEDLQITWRRHFYRKAPNGTCFVAVDRRNDTPCYMQWLLGAKHNQELAQFKCFPHLAPDEAILEQAYTIPSHRGLGVMSAAMTRIAERAVDFGARYVLTFVPENGIASLKGCQRAGFTPHLWHRRRQFGFGVVVHNSFKVMAEDDPRRKMPF